MDVVAGLCTNGRSDYDAPMRRTILAGLVLIACGESKPAEKEAAAAGTPAAAGSTWAVEASGAVSGAIRGAGQPCERTGDASMMVRVPAGPDTGGAEVFIKLDAEPKLRSVVLEKGEESFVFAAVRRPGDVTIDGAGLVRVDAHLFDSAAKAEVHLVGTVQCQPADPAKPWPVTPPAAAAKPQIDLALTGGVTHTIKGAGGECTANSVRIKSEDLLLGSVWSLTVDADDPRISFEEAAAPGTWFWTGRTGSDVGKARVERDGNRITVDVQLTHRTDKGPGGVARIQGTITCPM